MDRAKITNAIGFALIFLLFFAWMRMNAPSKEQLAKDKLKRDSIALAEKANVPAEKILPSVKVSDSASIAKITNDFGANYATALVGTDEQITLENDVFKIWFSSKGGKVSKVLLKKYIKISQDSTQKEVKNELYLLEDTKNEFSYILPIGKSAPLQSKNIFFKGTKNANTISFKADFGDGKSFTQTYSIEPNSYNIAYRVDLAGLGADWNPSVKQLELNWVNFMDRIEKNTGYEKNYSTVNFKIAEENPDYCNCQKTDEDNLEAPVKWISHTHQFFNSSLIAKDKFSSAVVGTEMHDDKSPDLKKAYSNIKFNIPNPNAASLQMDFYVGPNEFDRLQAYKMNLEDIISFGSSIFGTINRWIMHPLFAFLLKYIGSAGIVILILTLLVKLALLPLTLKMMKSQARMTSLKPYIQKIKDKHPDDTQTQQVETMSLYREFGVNPLGGCLPMLVQMPIWLALYRFFPSSIEFRQQSFLWATDLSSYDSIYQLGFSIPAYGDHVSLFSLLWMISTLAYSYYTMKDMDAMGQNAQMMKVMQYAMPVIFVVFFNNFASGLSCYLVFSNLLNIAQNLGIKKYFIDHDKILVKLEAYRSKPKKQGGFQERLETMMKEQRALKDKNKK